MKLLCPGEREDSPSVQILLIPTENDSGSKGTRGQAHVTPSVKGSVWL